MIRNIAQDIVYIPLNNSKIIIIWNLIFLSSHIIKAMMEISWKNNYILTQNLKQI